MNGVNFFVATHVSDILFLSDDLETAEEKYETAKKDLESTLAELNDM